MNNNPVLSIGPVHSAFPSLFSIESQRLEDWELNVTYSVASRVLALV